MKDTAVVTNTADGHVEAQSTYNPDRLLDELMSAMQLKNDSRLAKRLKVAPPIICKIRKRRLPVSPAVLISMHEESGYSIRDLRYLMGDMRPHTGKSAGPWPTAENYVKRNLAAGSSAAATACPY